MRTAAASQTESAAWLLKARLPGLLADLGYMVAITLGATASFVIAAAFGSPPDPHNSTLHLAVGTAIGSVTHIVPYLPICAVAANFAPATGFTRYACFAAVGA